MVWWYGTIPPTLGSPLLWTTILIVRFAVRRVSRSVSGSWILTSCHLFQKEQNHQRQRPSVRHLQIYLSIPFHLDSRFNFLTFCPFSAVVTIRYGTGTIQYYGTIEPYSYHTSKLYSLLSLNTTYSRATGGKGNQRKPFWRKAKVSTFRASYTREPWGWIPSNRLVSQHQLGSGLHYRCFVRNSWRIATSLEFRSERETRDL